MGKSGYRDRISLFLGLSLSLVKISNVVGKHKHQFLMIIKRKTVPARMNTTVEIRSRLEVWGSNFPLRSEAVALSDVCNYLSFSLWPMKSQIICCRSHVLTLKPFYSKKLGRGTKCDGRSELFH